jgi:hypothetical protein
MPFVLFSCLHDCLYLSSLFFVCIDRLLLFLSTYSYIEHFIHILNFFQSSFRFAGALKFEECVRALNDLFSRYSAVLIRDKFSRIRQVMMAITCDVNAPQAQSEHYSHLTANEVQAFMSLRKDKES